MPLQVVVKEEDWLRVTQQYLEKDHVVFAPQSKQNARKPRQLGPEGKQVVIFKQGYVGPRPHVSEQTPGITRARHRTTAPLPPKRPVVTRKHWCNWVPGRVDTLTRRPALPDGVVSAPGPCCP
jgi:hypothetical protein